MEKTTSHFASVCFSTSVVLKIILANFSSRELVKLSLVNKQWNYEARTIMKNRGNICAYQCSNKSCKDLVDFLSDMGKMSVVPFTGIRIFLSKQSHNKCDLSSTESVNAPLRINFPQFELKYFSVTLDDDDHDVDQFKKCPGFFLIKNILEDFSCLLEELELDFGSGATSCLGSCFEKCKFPHLKTLKFGDRVDTLDEAHIYFIRKLVARANAPCLKKVHIEGWVNFTINLVEDTSAVLYVPHCDFELADSEFSENLVGVVNFSRMVLLDLNEEYNLDKFNRIIPKLLESSQSTLCSLSIDSVFAALLMGYEVCFEKVKHFELNMDFNQLNSAHPRILEILKNFDFSQLFPNLTIVNVANRASDLSPDQMSELVHGGNVFFLLPTPNQRAVNIKHLSLSCCLEECNVPFFAHMCPDIQELTLLEAPRDVEIPYERVWEHWENLKEFAVEVSDQMMALVETVMRKWNLLGSPAEPTKSTLTRNLDGIFVGISPAELAELRTQDEDYLSAVNIVPIRPSITRLRALEIFRLRLLSNGRHYGQPHGSAFMFSKVSGLLAFKRCPKLSVILETDSAEIEAALSHLKPYASVVLDYQLPDNVFQ